MASGVITSKGWDMGFAFIPFLKPPLPWKHHMGYLSLKREGFISEEKETKTGNILMICIWLPSLDIIFLFSMFWQCHGPCRILVPQAGIELVLPPLGAWNLNHWTARESPHVAPILTILSLRLPKPHPQKA